MSFEYLLLSAYGSTAITLFEFSHISIGTVYSMFRRQILTSKNGPREELLKGLM